MTINLKDPAFDRLRSLNGNEILDERDRLTAEARTLLDRSADNLSADDAERFGQIERDLEFLRHTHETHQRMLSLVNQGAVEHGTAFDQPPQHRATGLAGQQTLTRDQSVATWARDNGLLGGLHGGLVAARRRPAHRLLAGVPARAVRRHWAGRVHRTSPRRHPALPARRVHHRHRGEVVMAGFEVIITAALENASAPDQAFEEYERPRREGIDLLLWRALPDANAPQHPA